MRLRSILSLSLAMGATALLAGCKKATNPRPACYSGVVLRDRCWDGVLIQVDSAFPIGGPISIPDSLGNSNVIAAVNSLGTLGVRGQRISFTYTNDPARQAPPRPCTADQIALPIPHLVLSNVSTTPCPPPWQ